MPQEHAISSKTEQDLKKKFRYSNLIKLIAHEEAKTQVASLQRELFQIAHPKTLTTKCQIIFSYPYWIKFKCKILFLYSLSIYVCLNSWEKNSKKLSANFEAFRYSFYWSISCIQVK